MTRPHPATFLAVFFASGFCGLIYESVWTHYLKIFVGHAAYAQTLVLAVFIGGLALGAGLVSRFASRVANPLRAYAIVEAAIGVIALLFHRVFVASTGWAYESLIPAACGDSSAPCLAQWALSIALLAPQSILLGTTFPLFCSAVLRLRADSPGRELSALYFVNSLGGVAGVLLCAYFLIPGFGLPGALVTAGIVNILIAMTAWFLAKVTPAPLDVEELPAPAQGEPRAGQLARLLLAVAFLTGLSSFIYEVAWIRMLSFVLGASTYSFELMLASFILGLALGGWWIRKRVDSLEDPVRFLGYVQLAMGVAAAATLAIYAYSFDLMAWTVSSLARNAQGFSLFNVGSAAIALVVMLPTTFCAGMTLPLITYRLLRSPAGERAIGAVYALNTLGAVAGVFVAVHVSLELVGLRWTLALGAAVDVALGVVLLWRPRAGRSPRHAWAACAAATVAVALLAAAFPIDGRRSAAGVFRTGVASIAPGDTVRFHRDGKAASIDVVAHAAGQLSLRTNGKPDAAMAVGPIPTADEYTMALLGLLPLGHHPAAKRAAVIGFGSGTTTAVLLASPNLEQVDSIEIESSVVQAAELFRPSVDAAYTDPRSRIVIDDAKSFFARGARRYDIIVSEPSNPWVSGVASLFTREFYQRISAHLNDGGVLSQWLHTYDMDAQVLASMLQAVSVSFPDFVLYTANEGDLVLIARKGGPPGLFDASAAEWPAAKSRLARLSLEDAARIRQRTVGSWSTLRPFFAWYGAPVNSDYFPFVERRAGQARFMRQRVPELLDLRAAPVPLLQIFDDAQSGSAMRPDRVTPDLVGQGEAVAWNVHDMVLGSAEPRGPRRGDAESAALVIRAWRQCRSDLTFAQVFPSLLTVAQATGPYLNDAPRAQIWDALASRPCRGTPGAEEREWMGLLAAVARRDAQGMMSNGAAVLARVGNPAGDASEYALAATAAGLLCRGERVQAAALLRQGKRWRRPGVQAEQWVWLEALADPAIPESTLNACRRRL